MIDLIFCITYDDFFLTSHFSALFHCGRAGRLRQRLQWPMVILLEYVEDSREWYYYRLAIIVGTFYDISPIWGRKSKDKRRAAICGNPCVHYFIKTKIIIFVADSVQIFKDKTDLGLPLPSWLFIRSIYAKVSLQMHDDWALLGINNKQIIRLDISLQAIPR